MYNRQTLAGPVTIEGVGLHSGRMTRLRLLPAEAGSGIVFVRTDADHTEIPADLDYAGPSFYATVIHRGDVEGFVRPLVSTVEKDGVQKIADLHVRVVEEFFIPVRIRIEPGVAIGIPDHLIDTRGALIDPRHGRVQSETDVRRTSRGLRPVAVVVADSKAVVAEPLVIELGGHEGHLGKLGIVGGEDVLALETLSRFLAFTLTVLLG